jgi:hypothetical protein
MALKLNKGGQTTIVTPQAPVAAQKQMAVAQSVPSPTLSFLKKGKAAQEAFNKEEHRKEVQSKGKFLRFWVPKDKESSITFLDGDLTPDGLLENPFYYEHNINLAGKWNNFFICTQDEEPCPICQGGASASYVAVFTVIDHSEYISKTDGQLKKDVVKLLVAKMDSVKLLQKYALKRGGLRGCRFDVTRTGDKSPSIGSAFDFTEKLVEADLVKKYAERSAPINYNEMLSSLYLNAKELRKLGFGSSAGPVGGEAPMSSEDYSASM